jgi:hypothetical protein
MTRYPVRTWAFGMGLLMVCGPVFAHHGTNAEYDSTRPITLKGTVTEFEFANPHAQIYFDVKDDAGNVMHWACETGSPGRLIRTGWTRNALLPGTRSRLALIRPGAARTWGLSVRS